MTKTRKEKAAGMAPPVVPTGALLGEVITWSAGAKARPYAEVVAALQTAALDETIAKKLLPRYAWARAARHLTENRVIDKLDETGEEIEFQLTRREKRDSEFIYDLETKLLLAKATGEIKCPIPELAEQARAALAESISTRTTSDISRIVQTLFDNHADLFPIREAGGCYFVPQRHTEFVAQVERFLDALGGTLKRFPVPAGTTWGDRSVKQSVHAGLTALLEEQKKLIDAFGEGTRLDTLDRQAERIRQVRYKVEAYQEYLADQADQLRQACDQADQRLRTRVHEVTRLREAKYSVCVAACDHCDHEQEVEPEASEWTCEQCHLLFPLEESPPSIPEASPEEESIPAA